jgi:transcriptional regulator with XRE-family HTH domain
LRTGMSQEEFASSIELKGETYRRYERGETEPNIATLAKLRSKYKVNLHHLISGEPDLVAETQHPRVIKAKKAG